MDDKIIIIEHPLCTARVSLRGAQLLSFKPKGGDELLWCTEREFWQDDKPIRGGIPLCWPWFGAHPDRTDLPSHGFARLMDWALLSSDGYDEFHQLTFGLESCGTTLTMWPHVFSARVVMTLGVSCSVHLIVETEGQWTGALHTYLGVNDITQTLISGLGDTYIDNLDGGAVKTAGKQLKLTSATEQMFTEPADCTQVRVGESSLVDMYHEGHTDVMLWTPWTNAGISPADMRTDSYKRMICIETAHISQPQKSGSLGVRIELKN